MPGPASCSTGHSTRGHSTSALTRATEHRITRPWVTRSARCQTRDTSHRARVTRLWITQPARVSARVTEPTRCWNRVTRSARCQSTDQWIERPQAPEAAGVAEYIVLVEAVAQIGIDPARPEDPNIPIALATEALPVSVATRAHTTATAVSATSSDSTRPPIQWGVGIPVHSSTSRGSSSRSPVMDPAAHVGAPPPI